VISRLQQEYDRGFQKKMADERDKQQRAEKKSAGKSVTYKGRRIEAYGDGFRVSPGDGSEFDSVKDAKRYVDDEVKMRGNSKRGVKAVAKQGARSVLKFYDAASGTIWDYSFGLPRKLAGKVVGVNNSRKRPNPDEGSADMYRSFHGKEPEGTTIIEEKVHEHEYLAPLGLFVNMEVHTITGGKATIGLNKADAKRLAQSDETAIDGSSVYLCTNEEGTQLFFVGGDQELPLEDLGLEDFVRDDMVIGEIRKITYRTQKGFDHFDLIEYYHQLGEETGDLPLLRYEPRSKLMAVTGGRYHIEKPLFGMSPGIEN